MRRQTSERGVMLIMALGLLTILWFMVLGFARSSSHELRLATASLATERSLAAAESGLVIALQHLKEDPEYRGDNKYTRLQYSQEEYFVEVLEGNKSPVPLPENTVFVRSYGKDRSGRIRQAAVVVQLGQGQESLLSFAVFASSLDINGGSAIESYDSEGSGSTDQATVGTNSTGPGAINLAAGTYIRGEIKVGETGIPGEAKPRNPTTDSKNTVWKNWNAWSLAESRLDQAQEYPPVDFPSIGSTKVKVDWSGVNLAPGAYSDLSASGGGEVRLSGGTYVFNSLKLTGGAKLSVPGDKPVVIYVKKDLDLSGGTVNNTSERARNLLFMMNKNSLAKLTGGARAYMTVYGPEASVEMSGGTRLYGAVVADDIRLNGGARIVYDVDLARNPPDVLSGGSTGGSFNILSWQQL
ncbi:MAG: collagen-binding domain-containing protein [Vulcanimicrobiota bacterium]